MVDLIGPGDAGAAPTLTSTTDVSAPTAGDTWFNDCPAGVADASATPIVSKWLNRQMQQLRKAIRFSGVPTSNAYDNMLSWAMQSGFANWIQSGLTGTANALVGNAPNAPLAIEGGTVVCGIVTTPTNTGAVSLDWSTLGAQPVLRNDGTTCQAGDILNNSFLVVRWDGAAWRICSPTPNAGDDDTGLGGGSTFIYGDIGSVFVGYRDHFGVFYTPTTYGYAGTWSTFGPAITADVSTGGGLYQGTIYTYKRVS